MTKFKKHEIIIRLLTNTQVLFYKNSIIVKGPKGIVSYSNFKNFSKYDITLEKHVIRISINYSNNQKNANLTQMSNLIKNLIFGVHFLFSKKLILVGIGLKTWIKKLKDNQKVLLIKAGFSQDLFINIPSSILVFSLRPTLLLIRSLSKEKANQFSSFIRLHKKPEKYKGIGIQYQNEVLLLKPGKKN